MTASKGDGSRGKKRRTPNTTASATAPTASVGRCVCGSLPANSMSRGARFNGETEHLADPTQKDAERNAVQIADQDGLGEEVGKKSERKNPAAIQAKPVSTARTTDSER